MKAAGDARVERDLIYALYAHSASVVIVAAFVGAMIVVAMWDSAPRAPLLAWYALVMAIQAARMVLTSAFRKEQPGGERIHLWARRYVAVVAAAALAYGGGAFFLLPSASPLGQVVTIVVLSALASGSISGYAYHPPVYIAFLWLSLLPLMAALLLQGTVMHAMLAIVLAFLFASTLAYGRGQASQLRTSIAFGHENAALVEELRRKTELAEAAQRKAEQASLAKSQFFAAASHDLRQPMQALGLYAASLRELKREPEDARKIDQILSSVDALESLFDELLDISKLDAGYVEPHLTHFPSGALFQRLNAAYAPIARQSGVSLEFPSVSVMLHSDPVLLERVLGNLISNGLRYTEAGGVTVACESRAGVAAISVEDTGIGIPASEHERVFDEFYQIANPERDRRKGLGLGLATVRRITRLLGTPLKLESQVGRGSRFILEVPLGDLAHAAAATPVPAAELDALAGARVLVIEDEASVREGLVELLRDWRCEVVAAASAAEALQLLSQAPEAIVADYRLRDGRNGIAAIGELREHFRAALPAILVTGDTAPEIFLAARENALPLLTKPVRAVRLRGALAHLLSGAAEKHRDVIRKLA